MFEEKIIASLYKTKMKNRHEKWKCRRTAKEFTYLTFLYHTYLKKLPTFSPLLHICPHSFHFYFTRDVIHFSCQPCKVRQCDDVSDNVEMYIFDVGYGN